MCLTTWTRQSGVVMFIDLIVLAAMSLAGVALMRSVDTTNMVARNLAFKEGSTQAADVAVEQVVNWISDRASGNTLFDNRTIDMRLVGSDDDDVVGCADTCYWAHWDANFVPNDYDWTNGAVRLPRDVAGNKAFVVVHRLCDAPGNPLAVACVKNPGGGTSSSTQVGAGYGVGGFAAGAEVYYRITARVLGPKNTVSYVQAVVY